MFFYIHAYIHTDIHIYVVNKCIYIYVYLIFLINVNGKVQVAHALLSPPGRQVTAPLHLVAAPAFCSLNNTWHSKLLVRSKGRLVQWLFRMYFLSSTTQGRHRPVGPWSGRLATPCHAPQKNNRAAFTRAAFAKRRSPAGPFADRSFARWKSLVRR